MNFDLSSIQDELNNRSISDFDGLTPTQMYFLVYDVFGHKSPLKLHTLDNSDYENIPILNQIQYLAHILQLKKELRLTKKGALPVKIVADIYHQGFLKDDIIESGIASLYKETDSMSIHLTRILIELMGIAKKRNGKLSLTKRADKILDSSFDTLKLLLETFSTKFNWAYFDGFGQNHIGQFGVGFSLAMLSKYGNEKKPENFYADKYFTAFPDLLETTELSRFDTRENQGFRCYSLRTFSRFLDYFNLIEMTSEKSLESETFVNKSTLFEKLITFESS